MEETAAQRAFTESSLDTCNCKGLDPLLYAVGDSHLIVVASMRQEEASASSSCNCVFVSSVKSSLNTIPNCSILGTNNKKISGDGV